MHFTRSRQGHLAGILGMLALFGAGCGSNQPSANAYVSLQWDIFDVGDTTMNSPLTCADVGGGAIVLTSVNQATQMTYTDTFACATAAGSSANLPSGTYSLTVSLYGDPTKYGNSTTLLDQVTYTQTLLSGPNPLPVVDFMVNSFVLGWTVTSGGLATTCTAVGGSYVELDIYFSGQTQPTAYYLDCLGYNPAATLSIPMGTYNVQWQAFLVDANYRDVPGTAGTQLASYTVATGVQANLGTVYFAF
jgi:hypothetical protein